MSRHLAIDLGASSGRVALGTLEDGRLSTRILHRFPNGGVQVQGRLYWDVLGLWREVLHGLKLAAETGEPISSVGVNSWAVDYALLGAQGDLMGGGVRHYRDPRTAGQMERAFEKVGRDEIYARTGIQFLPFNTAYQWLAEDPQTLRSAHTALMVPDLLHFWLCGVAVTEQTNASTTQLYDPGVGDWSAALLHGLGLPTQLFPKIVPPGTVLGPLSPEVEALTGLRGVQVIAPATHDTASAVAAVPASGPGWAYISSGTWSLVGTETARPVINADTLRHNLTNEAGVGGTTRLLKNIMGLWMVQECCRLWGVTDYAALYAEAARVPSGAVIDPDDARFLAPFDMQAQVQAACRETGQAEPATRPEVVRVILDSLAHKVAAALHILEEVSGQAIHTVHVVGGGSQIALLNGLIADASGRTVIAGPVEATLEGNLLVQAAALGLLEAGQVREVVQRSVDLKTFLPSALSSPVHSEVS
ncbi:rhamnulokinase family protein [Deinococcus altitudinis]|uniref:rhamnulokinase n=1 Tax=Deinococcus altitudinis TaxID=468914 RepID=UPI003892480A